MNLKYASTALQNDPEVVLEAIKKEKTPFKFAGPELKEKYPTVEKFIESTKEKAKSKEEKKEKPTRSRIRLNENEK